MNNKVMDFMTNKFAPKVNKVVKNLGYQQFKMQLCLRFRSFLSVL